MNRALHLVIATPARVLLDDAEVASVRAEDDTGSFGIEPGHAAFLTVLVPSLIRWRGPDAVEHYCAIEAGVLRVADGQRVSVVCRDGVLGDSIPELEARVGASRRKQADAAHRARADQTGLHARAVRQLLRYLRPETAPATGFVAPGDDDRTGGES